MELIAAIIGAISTLVGVFLTHKLRAQKDPLPKDIDRNDNIYAALSYLITETEADRCYVYEFHNGDYYYSGNSQQKFSNTYEIVEEGISCEAAQEQNLRVSSYNFFIKQLINEGGVCYANTEKIPDPLFKEKMHNKGIQSISCVPIKLLNGKIIGILGIDYVKHKVNCDGEMFNLLKNQARIISGYLGE
jgi:hypothetical protein